MKFFQLAVIDRALTDVLDWIFLINYFYSSIIIQIQLQLSIHYND
jgi:hypothetical protein